MRHDFFCCLVAAITLVAGIVTSSPGAAHQEAEEAVISDDIQTLRGEAVPLNRVVEAFFGHLTHARKEGEQYWTYFLNQELGLSSLKGQTLSEVFWAISNAQTEARPIVRPNPQEQAALAERWRNMTVQEFSEAQSDYLEDRARTIGRIYWSMLRKLDDSGYDIQLIFRYLEAKIRPNVSVRRGGARALGVESTPFSAELVEPFFLESREDYGF